MKYPLSIFGTQLALDSGIGELMQDLGEAIASGDDDLCMLGGGQPSHIPEVDDIWQRRLRSIAADSAQVVAALGDYQPPSGDAAFRDSIANLFRNEYGWEINADNVCITAGGQTAFFLLLNALAGKMRDGTHRKVLLPLVPEYIGYADQSTCGNMFRAVKPIINKINDHEFKYSIDFDALTIDKDISAIVLSRPTNPSANVIDDDELSRLADLAAKHGIPLLVDNAYGDPFPGVIFTETTPLWRPGMILTYSLSKLGLPGTRTGIVIAEPEVVAALSSMNAITSLANNNVGQAMVKPLIEDGQILRISRETIRPFYLDRSRKVMRWMKESFDDSVPYRIHTSEGAFFLWLWFEDLPITSAELYQRLKAKGVLVISGHYFFFGTENTDSDERSNGDSGQRKAVWKHSQECIRVSFTADERVLQKGIRVLADQVNALYSQASD